MKNEQKNWNIVLLMKGKKKRASSYNQMAKMHKTIKQYCPVITSPVLYVYIAFTEGFIEDKVFCNKRLSLILYSFSFEQV